MLSSRVICDLIAYILLVKCVPPRIAYALTNVDNPQNCVRPELKLFTESMRLRTWRVEGGEAGVLKFLHHGTQPDASMAT